MSTTTQGARAEQYRKKPVVIEAIQWPGTKFESAPPQWFRDAMYADPGTPGFVIRIGDRILIETLEGQVWAQPGDWIIRGVKGELYPCKPDIFAATYEPAALAAQPAAPVVPEGYVLVPSEPTEAMVHAAEDLPAPRMFGKVYRAMLAASPQVEVAPQAEQVAKKVLTDEQIIAAWDAQWRTHGHEPCKMSHLDFGRTVEAMVSSRCRAQGGATQPSNSESTATRTAEGADKRDAEGSAA